LNGRRIRNGILGRQICADQSNEAGAEKEFHNGDWFFQWDAGC